MFSKVNKEKADVLIIGGDIIPHDLEIIGMSGSDILWGQEKYLRDVFVPAIKVQMGIRPIPVYLDLSNDDFMSTRKVLEQYDGILFHLLHQRKHPLTDSADIIGYMNVPPTPFGRKDWEKPDTSEQRYAPGNFISVDGSISVNGELRRTFLDLRSDDTIERDLDRLSESIDKPFIFISHAPPYKTPLDVIYDGTHVGSLAVRKFIEKWAEKGLLIISFHGHIHESPRRSGSICTKIGNTLCINPGQGSRRGSTFRYVVSEFGQGEDGTLIMGRIFGDLDEQAYA